MPVSGDDNHKKVSINAAFLLEAALPDTPQNSIDQTVPNRNTWNQLSVFNSAPECWSNAHDILTRNWYQKLVKGVERHHNPYQNFRCVIPPNSIKSKFTHTHFIFIQTLLTLLTLFTLFLYTLFL